LSVDNDDIVKLIYTVNCSAGYLVHFVITRYCYFYQLIFFFRYSLFTSSPISMLFCVEWDIKPLH